MCVCIVDHRSRDFETACLRHRESNPPGWVCDSSVRGKSSHVETRFVATGADHEVRVCADVDMSGNCRDIVRSESRMFNEEHQVNEVTLQLSHFSALEMNDIVHGCCLVMSVAWSCDSGLKTVSSTNVVLNCNISQQSCALCPIALTAMAFSAAPARTSRKNGMEQMVSRFMCPRTSRRRLRSAWKCTSGWSVICQSTR